MKQKNTLLALSIILVSTYHIPMSALGQQLSAGEKYQISLINMPSQKGQLSIQNESNKRVDIRYREYNTQSNLFEEKTTEVAPDSEVILGDRTHIRDIRYQSQEGLFTKEHKITDSGEAFFDTGMQESGDVTIYLDHSKLTGWKYRAA